MNPNTNTPWADAEHNLMDFLYNEDRAIASLGGADPQATISAESGDFANRELVAALLCKVLDKIQKNHCVNAEAHAAALEAADREFADGTSQA